MHITIPTMHIKIAPMVTQKVGFFHAARFLMRPLVSTSPNASGIPNIIALSVAKFSKEAE